MTRRTLMFCFFLLITWITGCFSYPQSREGVGDDDGSGSSTYDISGLSSLLSGWGSGSISALLSGWGTGSGSSDGFSGDPTASISDNPIASGISNPTTAPLSGLGSGDNIPDPTTIDLIALLSTSGSGSGDGISDNPTTSDISNPTTTASTVQSESIAPLSTGSGDDIPEDPTTSDILSPTTTVRLSGLDHSDGTSNPTASDISNPTTTTTTTTTDDLLGAIIVRLGSGGGVSSDISATSDISDPTTASITTAATDVPSELLFGSGSDNGVSSGSGDPSPTASTDISNAVTSQDSNVSTSLVTPTGSPRPSLFREILLIISSLVGAGVLVGVVILIVASIVTAIKQHWNRNRVRSFKRQSFRQGKDNLQLRRRTYA